MRVFVTGAGISKGVDYPLGAELLSEIDSYVRNSGPCVDRFDYKDWAKMTAWFQQNPNLIIRQAYATRNLEHLFTALDFIEQLRQQQLDAVAGYVFKGQKDTHGAKQAEADWTAINNETVTHAGYRRWLLWALEQYLEDKHQRDQTAFKKKEWEHLHSFGRKLCAGDGVITFNYDSVLERVLLEQGKWYPSDGYGFGVSFQASRLDQAPVEFPDSPIKILHLHGAVGWYTKPLFKDESLPPDDSVAVPLEALAPGALETEIALDPLFLQGLGLSAVDASLSSRPAQERQVFIHPSFFKNYELNGQNSVFLQLWKDAADALRKADEIFIIGYSLPEADSAALTLLVTTCAGKNVRIVNHDASTSNRLNRLLDQKVWPTVVSLEQWLAEMPDCTTNSPS